MDQNRLWQYNCGLIDGFSKAEDTLSFANLVHENFNKDYQRGLEEGRRLFRQSICDEKIRLTLGIELKNN